MRFAVGWLFLFLFLTNPAWAENFGIFVKQANLVRQESSVVLSADVAYELNPAAIEALANGIPITLELELTVGRERQFWPDETLLNERRKIQLRYQPLAKSYQIADQSSGAVQNFSALSSMVDTLSRIRGWEIPTQGLLESHEVYPLTLRVCLDIESLPLPLRVVAYISPEWHLDCPDYEWQEEL